MNALEPVPKPAPPDPLPDADLPDGYRVVLIPNKDHAPKEDSGGVQYQKCGGGRRVLRKRIGGD